MGLYKIYKFIDAKYSPIVGCLAASPIEEFKELFISIQNKTGVMRDFFGFEYEKNNTLTFYDFTGDLEKLINVTFNDLLIKRFNERILKNGEKGINLMNMSHQELMSLAENISKNKGDYNAQAKTFMHTMIERSFNSKSDILKDLKKVKNDLVIKYPDLNIEAISIQVKNGNFDLQPCNQIP
jgi:hypothetical protein